MRVRVCVFVMTSSKRAPANRAHLITIIIIVIIAMLSLLLLLLLLMRVSTNGRPGPGQARPQESGPVVVGRSRWAADQPGAGTMGRPLEPKRISRARRAQDNGRGREIDFHNLRRATSCPFWAEAGAVAVAVWRQLSLPRQPAASRASRWLFAGGWREWRRTRDGASR